MDRNSKNDIVNEFYEKENYSYDSKIQKWKTKYWKCLHS